MPEPQSGDPSGAQIARLRERGVVSVTGPDSEKLLQGIVTNDLEGLAEGEARYAGLLSPQGKILFDFLVVRHGNGYLLDVARIKTVDLAKRLTMYKLRADVMISDVSSAFDVFAVWGVDSKNLVAGHGIAFSDPRNAAIGLVLLADTSDDFARLKADDSQRAYDARRVEFVIPEAGKDYEFGDAYPHEANFDLLHGVSFTKGCYVGQEIVARMQNKTVVRRRAVKVSAKDPLTENTEILLGDIPVGRIGTADGTTAIAMLRLDRALEAEQKNLPLLAAGISITPDADAVESYRKSAAARATSSALPAP